MDLVDHQHLHSDRLHDPQGGLFHLRDIGAGRLWRAEKGEKLTVEAALAGAGYPAQPSRLSLSAEGERLRWFVLPQEISYRDEARAAGA